MNNSYYDESKNFLVMGSIEMDAFIDLYNRTMEVKGESNEVKYLLNLVFFKGYSQNQFSKSNNNYNIEGRLNRDVILLQLLANCAESFYTKDYDSLSDSERIIQELILLLVDDEYTINSNMLSSVLNIILVSNNLLSTLVDTGIENHQNNRKQICVYDNVTAPILEVAYKVNNLAFSKIDEKSK